MAAPPTFSHLSPDVNKIIEDLNGNLKEMEMINFQFNLSHHLLNHGGTPTDNNNILLKQFLELAYSVLDYSCFAIYCHNRKGGRLSFSNEACSIKFPTSFSLKKTDPGNAREAQEYEPNRLKWMQRVSRDMLGHEDLAFAKFFLDLQPMNECDKGGSILRVVRSSPDAVQFSLLHFLRNVVAHRSLITVVPSQGYIHIKKGLRYERVFNNSPSLGPEWDTIPVAAGMWIAVPAENETPQEEPDLQERSLMEVADEIINFVKFTRSYMLSHGLGIPPNTNQQVTWGSAIFRRGTPNIRPLVYN
eukprot:TRINITY_DN21049_c0_g1_i1.p1 TRINITY_DN21049_c0_g1~~TRINITY_DN21049_c0_g1_i1.p1  ORF type:complete len:302 (+),score=13.16 TRINITY_DN21049_c0_g1_i1:57-962(+)